MVWSGSDMGQGEIVAPGTKERGKRKTKETKFPKRRK